MPRGLGKWLFTGACVTLILMTLLFADREWFPAGLRNDITFKSGIMPGVVFLVAFWCGTWWMSALKAGTNVVLTHGMKFFMNPADGLYPAGIWTIKRLGGTLRSDVGIALAGREGALIAPTPAWRYMGGGNLIVAAKPERVDFRDLPDKVRQKLREKSIPPPYYLAVAPVVVETRGRDYTYEWRQALLRNRDEYHTIEVSERSMAAADRMNQKLVALSKDVGRPARTGLLSRLLPRERDERDEATDTEDDPNRLQ